MQIRPLIMNNSVTTLDEILLLHFAVEIFLTPLSASVKESLFFSVPLFQAVILTFLQMLIHLWIQIQKNNGYPKPQHLRFQYFEKLLQFFADFHCLLWHFQWACVVPCYID